DANALASSLAKLGVRKGTHVAVLLGNHPAFPTSWVALGRLGAAMVPVNTAYTSDEIAFILRDSDAQFLIVGKSHIEKVRSIIESLDLLDESRIVVVGESGQQNSIESLIQHGDPFFSPNYTV